MNTHTAVPAVAATSAAGTTSTTPRPGSADQGRAVRSALWMGLAVLAVIGLYVLTERSAWYASLSVPVASLVRISAVTLIVGVLAGLNPWRSRERATS